MSLKSFHLIFISAASALAFGFCVWELKEFFSSHGETSNLVMGLGALGAGAGLILYERYFLKRTKKVGYL